jgi:taurine dioxygenase
MWLTPIEKGANPMTHIALPDIDTSAIQVSPLSLHIGALIGGVDLTQALSSAQVSAIRAALLKWKVVFFRNQFLSHDQHVAFARNFGELTVGHPVFGHVKDHPEIYEIAKHRTGVRFNGERLQRPWTGWHTDVTAAVNPPAASILRASVIPPFGGDTLWTNLAVAYKKLSPPLQSFLQQLRGTHQFSAPRGVTGTDRYNADVERNRLISEHPLVRVHPETGERVLYVSPGFLKSVTGLLPRESEILLELLWEHAVRSDFTVRFKWEPGSIAFWDNRSTAHLAPTDIFDQEEDRQLFRITLVGDVPVGVDGRPSSSIEGDRVGAASATAATN